MTVDVTEQVTVDVTEVKHTHTHARSGGGRGRCAVRGAHGVTLQTIVVVWTVVLDVVGVKAIAVVVVLAVVTVPPHAQC